MNLEHVLYKLSSCILAFVTMQNSVGQVQWALLWRNISYHLYYEKKIHRHKQFVTSRNLKLSLSGPACVC
jgi:hypothetical protein